MGKRAFGAVARLSDDVSAYAQYSDGKDPVNANIFLVNSGENLDLTDVEQWEVGLKGSWHEGRTQATIAYFDIQRDLMCSKELGLTPRQVSAVAIQVVSKYHQRLILSRSGAWALTLPLLMQNLEDLQIL